MAQKVQIEIEVLNNQAKAEFDATAKGVAEISDKAAESASKVKKSFEEVGKAQRAAFASDQTKKALNENTQAVDKLATELEMLYKEEVRLLQLNKQSTEQYKQNRAEAERIRGEFDKLNKTQSNYGKTVVKTSQDVSKLEDQLRKLALEGKQGTKEFDDIAKAIGEYKAAITTADRAVDLYAKTTDAATGRLGELEDKLYDLAIAGKQGTQEFKDTVQEVATLKRAVFEVDQQVDSYVERSRGLTSVVQNVELLGNAFQIAEGASALFGTESEELQETLVRLNAIMVVTQGLERARQILLEQTAKQTGIAAVAQRAYTVAVGTSTGALKLLRATLATLGFGAILVAIGFLIEKIISMAGESDKLTTALNQSNKALNNASKAISNLAEKIEDAKTRIRIANGEITKTQADLIKSLKEVESEGAKAYLPLLKESNNLKNNLFALDVQISKQQKTLERFANNEEIRLATERTLAALQEKRIKIIEAINKNEEARNAIVKNSKELQSLLIKESKLSEQQTQELTKKVDEQTRVYEQLSIAINDVTKQLIEQDRILQQSFTDTLIQNRENELSKVRILFEQGLATRKQVADAEIRLVLANQRLQIEAVENSLKKQLVGVKLFSEQEIAIKTNAKAQIANIEQQSAEEIFNINKQLINDIESEQDKINQELNKINDELKKQILGTLQAVSNAFTSISDLANELSQRRIDQIERQRDAELEANNVLEQSYAKRIRNEEAITLRSNRKIIEEKRKQAKLDKATAIFNATIQTAQAIVGFLANPSGFAGVALSIAAGITGATQIAKISSEPLPKFGTGGFADKKEGLLRGKSHSEGGIPIEVEGGEFIVNKRRTKHHMKELVAMNTSRTAYDKLIQEMYVRPKLEQFALEFRNSNQAVNVNASLNSTQMEAELKALRRETKRTGKVITNALSKSASSRYNWN